MNTERSLAKVPRQETNFDPDSVEDPVHALTLLVRGLRLGERVRLPNDSVVISRTVKVGPHQQRRFSVLPSVSKSSPQERHRALALGHDAFKTAEQAARKAMEDIHKEGRSDH